MSKISYQLAKELKDAGFPQLNHMIEWELDKKVLNGVGYHLTADAPDEVYPDGRLINKARYTSIYKRDWVLSEEGLAATVYIPTLPELIEACGDEFSHLIRYYTDLKQLWWIAVRTGDSINKLPNGLHGYSSPDEAVANLYLFLDRQRYGQ